MLIGRKSEQQQLKDALQSDKSEFVVVYGRRRVGKTYLVREVLGDSFTFVYTGIKKITNSQQIKIFTRNLEKQGATITKKPTNWFEAFDCLADLVDRSSNARKTIFIDEIPWMDRVKSNFVPALEYFWNSWASARKDIVLIICGSASSWIIKKVFKNKGGLHRRVSQSIHLHPFSLLECEQYADALGLPFNRNQILEGYMVMGGVPMYWSQLSPQKSLAQNINDLFLAQDGALRYEFNDLYASIFDSPENYIKIIDALASKKKGLTRSEIVEVSKLENNGTLSEMIENLIECGFIRKYCHTGKKLRDALYQLVDFYTIFYYQFVKNAYGIDDNYWVKIQVSPTYATWCGLAFERVVLMHSRQLKNALGISGIIANIYSWHIRGTETSEGVQIDMLIDRSDKVINLCEMKYYPLGYKMSKKDAETIMAKIRVLSDNMPKNRAIQLVMITSNGMLPGPNSIPGTIAIEADQLFIP
ncbi:MAG: AAA family ATPase [Bacteroidales bacterium]|nr:AAA family ATPase [Bacteroidales bacterium]